MNGIIYKATNRVNKKRYVGQTKLPLSERIGLHLGSVRRGSSWPFHCAIRKYGIQTFDFAIIDQASDHKTLDEKEIYWIKQLKTRTIQRGYNVHCGGTNHTEFSFVPGKKRPPVRPEVRAQISRTMKGRQLTPGWKISAAKTGVKRPNMTGDKHPMFGKHPVAWNKGMKGSTPKWTEERLQKHIEMLKARWAAPGAREEWTAKTTGRKHAPHSEETKAKLRAYHQSPEGMAASLRGALKRWSSDSIQ